jgi:hypothetical protein
MLRDEGQAEADRYTAHLKQVGVNIIWGMDEATMLTAAHTKAQHPVTLADALFAAFAVCAGAVLMRKDPELDSLTEEGSWIGCRTSWRQHDGTAFRRERVGLGSIWQIW